MDVDLHVLCHLLLLTGHQQRANTDTAYVNVLTRGDLSSLHWIESPLRYFNAADHPDQQLCRVHFTALNFRDIMHRSQLPRHHAGHRKIAAGCYSWYCFQMSGQYLLN